MYFHSKKDYIWFKGQIWPHSKNVNIYYGKWMGILVTWYICLVMFSHCESIENTCNYWKYINYMQAFSPSLLQPESVKCIFPKASLPTTFTYWVSAVCLGIEKRVIKGIMCFLYTTTQEPFTRYNEIYDFRRRFLTHHQ